MRERIEIEEVEVYGGSLPVPRPHAHTRTKYMRTAGRTCLFLIAFLAPLFFLPATEDPVGTNKLMMIGLLSLIAFVCFLGCLFEERKIEYPRSWFSFILIFFIAIEGISAYFSMDRYQSLYGHFTSPDSFLGIAIVAGIFYLSFFFFRRADIAKAGGFMAAGLAIASVISLLGIFGLIALQSPVGSFTEWGILLVGGIAALAGADLESLSINQKRIFFSAAAVAVIVLFFLNMEFLWLSLAVAMIVLAALRLEPKQQFRYAFVVIVLALFFALIGPRLPMFTKISPDVRPDLSATAAAVQTAMHGWRILTGSGPATFSLDFSGFHTSPIAQGYSFLITLLATGGLLGFFLFFLLIAIVAHWALKIEFLEADLAMVLSLVVFLIAMLVVYPAFFAELVIIFMFIGLFLGAESRRELSFQHFSRGVSFTISIIIMLCAAGSLAVAYSGGEQYAAAVDFGQANSLAASGNTSGALAKVSAALGFDKNDEYLRGASNILLQEAQQVASAGNQSNTQQLAPIIANAVEAAQSATVTSPRDPVNWGNLGSVYESIMPVVNGADQLAEQSYSNAAALDPQNPEWDLALGRTYMESANLLSSDASNDVARQAAWSNAEIFLQKAISLKSDYSDPRVLLVQLYLKEGNISQAIAKVQELKQQNPLDPGVAFELGYLYLQNNQVDQAQEEFQVAIILDADYANARYYLGTIYAQKGMTAQALEQFQAVQTLNPGNQDIANAIANLQAGQSVQNSASSSLVPPSPSEITVPKAASQSKAKK